MKTKKTLMEYRRILSSDFGDVKPTSSRLKYRLYQKFSNLHKKIFDLKNCFMDQ